MSSTAQDTSMARRGPGPIGAQENRLTLRMLGGSQTFRRWQWEELCEELRDGSGLRLRIEELLRVEQRDGEHS